MVRIVGSWVHQSFSSWLIRIQDTQYTYPSTKHTHTLLPNIPRSSPFMPNLPTPFSFFPFHAKPTHLLPIFFLHVKPPHSSPLLYHWATIDSVSSRSEIGGLKILSQYMYVLQSTLSMTVHISSEINFSRTQDPITLVDSTLKDFQGFLGDTTNYIYILYSAIHRYNDIFFLLILYLIISFRVPSPLILTSPPSSHPNQNIG